MSEPFFLFLDLHVPPFMRRVVLFNAAHCLRARAIIINAVITDAAAAAAADVENKILD